MNRRSAFRWFLISRSISWAGSAVTLVALPVLTYQRTGSAALTGLLTALEAAPYLVLGLPVGALADRWDRRRTMVVSRLFSAAAIASVPIADALDVLTTPQLLVVAVLVSSSFVFDDAAGFGALPEIVGRDGLAAAFGTMASVSTMIGFLGPAAGGVLAATVGAAEVLAFDALTWLVSAVLIARITWQQSEAPAETTGSRLDRTRRDIVEGLRFVWHHDVVRTLTLMGTGLSLSLGAVTGLLVVHGVEHLRLTDDDARLGLLYAATSLGALLVSLALGRIQARVRTGTITLVAITVNGLGVLAWSGAPTLAAGLVILVVWQAAATLAILNGIVVRQAVTPDRMQARVNTTARMIAWGGTPFGAAVAGVVAEAYGSSAAVAAASGPIVVSLLIGVRSGIWRVGTLRTITDESRGVGV